MGRPRGSGQKKPARRTVELIDQNSATGGPMYRLLKRLVDAHHQEVSGARFALAWNRTWKARAGTLKLGRCKRCSPLDRELAPYDFVITLNFMFWTDPETKDIQREALLDHELYHADVAEDKDGEVRVDAAGRKVYRIRPHDIEEFGAIVKRYGLWKGDLERFAVSMRQSQQGDMLAQAAPPKPKIVHGNKGTGAGAPPVVEGNGGAGGTQTGAGSAGA